MLGKRWKEVISNTYFDKTVLIIAFQQLQDLKIDIEYIRKSGPEGHTNTERTIQMFQKLTRDTKLKLTQVYRNDFTLFGYNWKKYLNN